MQRLALLAFLFLPSPPFSLRISAANIPMPSRPSSPLWASLPPLAFSSFFLKSHREPWLARFGWLFILAGGALDHSSKSHASSPQFWLYAHIASLPHRRSLPCLVLARSRNWLNAGFLQHPSAFARSHS